MTDLPAIEPALKHSYEHAEAGFGYPRCVSGAELLAELAVYGCPLESSLAMVENDGVLVGFYGFLYDANDVGTTGFAFLVGPHACNSPYDPDLIGGMLGVAERAARARRIGQLRSIPTIQNTHMTDLLEARGWQSGISSIEMKWDATTPTGNQHAQHRVERLGHTNPRLEEVAGLLADGFGWDNATHRLTQYLADGYAIGLVTDRNAVLGAGLWTKVGDTDFGRVENVVVRPDSRRCGVGGALVLAALRDLQDTGAPTVYLSVDEGNAGARALYRRCGFTETIHSVSYSLDPKIVR